MRFRFVADGWPLRAHGYMLRSHVAEGLNRLHERGLGVKVVVLHEPDVAAADELVGGEVVDGEPLVHCCGVKEDALVGGSLQLESFFDDLALVMIDVGLEKTPEHGRSVPVAAGARDRSETGDRDFVGAAAIAEGRMVHVDGVPVQRLLLGRLDGISELR